MRGSEEFATPSAQCPFSESVLEDSTCNSRRPERASGPESPPTQDVVPAHSPQMPKIRLTGTSGVCKALILRWNTPSRWVESPEVGRADPGQRKWLKRQPRHTCRHRTPSLSRAIHQQAHRGSSLARESGPIGWGTAAHWITAPRKLKAPGYDGRLDGAPLHFGGTSSCSPSSAGVGNTPLRNLSEQARTNWQRGGAPEEAVGTGRTPRDGALPFGFG